jgi:galactose-1-phosphate uridylyltransferase
MLLDAFKACCLYFEQLHGAFPKVKYTAIVMNFLPPAGSTIAHPHIQALASDIPIQAIADIADATRRYHTKNGSNYWLDLTKTERGLGARFLANLNGVDWLTPFAPVGLNEADAIVLGKPRFNSLSEENWNGLTEGMVKVLKFYQELGVRSFNAALYASPLDDDSIPVTVRMVSRYGYRPKFVSDVWALQYLLGEQEVFESPEETCSKLATYFK